MKAAEKKRRPYVTNPDVCRTCLYGQQGCPVVAHLGKEVVACIGYKPAAVRI